MKWYHKVQPCAGKLLCFARSRFVARRGTYLGYPGSTAEGPGDHLSGGRKLFWKFSFHKYERASISSALFIENSVTLPPIICAISRTRCSGRSSLTIVTVRSS